LRTHYVYALACASVLSSEHQRTARRDALSITRVREHVLAVPVPVVLPTNSDKPANRTEASTDALPIAVQALGHRGSKQTLRRCVSASLRGQLGCGSRSCCLRRSRAYTTALRRRG